MKVTPIYKNLEELQHKNVLDTVSCDRDLSVPYDIIRYHVIHGSIIPTLTPSELSLLLNVILPKMIEQKSYTVTYTSLTDTEEVISPTNSIVMRNLFNKGFLIKENKISFRLNFNNIIPQPRLTKFKNAFEQIQKDTGITPTKKGAILQNEHKAQVTDRLLHLLAYDEDEWQLRKPDRQIIHYLINKVDMSNIANINLTEMRKGYKTLAQPYLNSTKKIEVLRPYTLSVLNKSLIKLRDLEVFQVISSNPVNKFKKDVNYKIFINPRMIMRSPNRWTAFVFVSEVIFEAQRRGDNSIPEGLFDVLLEKATKTVTRLKVERNKIRHQYMKDKKFLHQRIKEDEKGINPLTNEEYELLQPTYEGFNVTANKIPRF